MIFHRIIQNIPLKNFINILISNQTKRISPISSQLYIKNNYNQLKTNEIETNEKNEQNISNGFNDLEMRRKYLQEQQQKEHDVAQCRSSYLRMEPSITLYCHR